MEWSFEVDFGMEWSRILEWNGVRFCVFVTLLGQDFTTDSDGVELGQILEGTSRLKLRQNQTIFYDLPKMSTFIQQVWV